MVVTVVVGGSTMRVRMLRITLFSGAEEEPNIVDLPRWKSVTSSVETHALGPMCAVSARSRVLQVVGRRERG
jgi:hypothetical protein